MFSGLRLRHRIGLLLALAVFGLGTVTVTTLVLGRRSERELVRVETRYVPLLELDRDLGSLFDRITAALEDAASAAEDSRIQDADGHVDELRRRLAAGRDTIAHNGGDARVLRDKLDAYYRTARAVAAAMVAGAGASELGDQIETMSARQREFAALLDAATSPDRTRLAAAFAAAREAQRRALWIDIAVASGVFALMAWLSLTMIRRMTRSLQAVSLGVERLARGEFGQEIEVTSRDEIGDLAREANRTAIRLREYRDELEARNAELARASQYKSEFLANMSHELRTPLNSIMILSQVLAENDGNTLTAKQVEFAQTIHRSGQELLAHINEVLDLAKIESGKQAIELSTQSIAELSSYMRRMFQPVAAQKNVQFEIIVADDAPPEVRTDSTRLAQIVKNLLANAFKFTERGAVTVRIGRSEESVAARYPDIVEPYTIAVTDTGIGIAADKLGAIFEAFTQAESGTSRKYGGTGLGLTIAKQLANLLGGDLTVVSTLASGSTFTLVLPAQGPRGGEAAAPEVGGLEPVRRPARAQPTPASALPAVPQLAGKTVLVVDDDMRNVYSLASALRERKLTVLTAADGRDALEQLAGSDVDIVLIDVMMPELDGPQTIQEIRARARFRDVPIIALTAASTPEERQRCVDAGANGCLGKPLDLAQLLALLARLTPTATEPDPAA